MARLPTVYDFSSLRLHPDGTRVLQSTSQNQKKRYAPQALQDSRGNWFARDAAGSGTVGKYQKVKDVKDKKAELEEQLNDGEDGEEDELSKGKENGEEEETTTRRKQNLRPAKRRKFMQNFDFLSTTASNASEHTHALPSSDLLKSIQYFASSYYHERGQLFNATKEYRRKRKQNRLKRLEKQKKVEEDREDSEELDEDSEEYDEDSEQGEADEPSRGGRRKGVFGRIIHRKDMYKMLDGSALMAIGMLIQEYVSRSLEVRKPDGWEDMLRNAVIDEEARNTDVEMMDANSENYTGNDRASDESGGEDEEIEVQQGARARGGRGGRVRVRGGRARGVRGRGVRGRGVRGGRGRGVRGVRGARGVGGARGARGVGGVRGVRGVRGGGRGVRGRGRT